MKRSIWAALLAICLVAGCVMPAGTLVPYVGNPVPSSDAFDGEMDSESGWITKWKGEPDPAFVEESLIAAYYPELQVTVARPANGDRIQDWLKRWRSAETVEFMHPNHRYEISLAPNDPLYGNQDYLKQIRAEQAWDIVRSNEEIIIAVVDTGVDLNHPDLSGRLVEGVNLIDPSKPPMDDNGHGTNIAGILAAAGNNDVGTAGLLWNAKIMPIKALEANGTGDEDKLGIGIMHAIDNGAKIVVLSLGLNKYSNFMHNIVQYAEVKNVLLVAAAGNENNEVKYPAAYSTVLAVGGVDKNNNVVASSNKGAELDLVAPWEVYTTGRGGRYVYNHGTSMAAPQVAAVAALVWSRYPHLTAAQLREHLRHTADDLGPAGWDEASGYGLLRADRAVSTPPKADYYEPNNTRADAKRISYEKTLTAGFTPGDEDWYRIEVPYDGTVQFRFMNAPANFRVKLSLIGVDKPFDKTYVGSLGTPEGARFDLKAGSYYLRLEPLETIRAFQEYTLVPSFFIYKDAFEDNDRQYMAYKLPTRSQLVVGTFHQEDDLDWYSMTIDQAGKLRLEAATDTPRMDLVLRVEKQGARAITRDERGEGENEVLELDVTPGTYYIRVSNYYPIDQPIRGEYYLDIRLTTPNADPFEPNDRSYQATTVSFDMMHYGTLDKPGDVDWFRFSVQDSSLVTITLEPSPFFHNMDVQLLDATLKPIRLQQNSANSFSRWTAEAKLDKGIYYIKLQSKIVNGWAYYGLKVTSAKLAGGFVDVLGHWAEQDMLLMIEQHYVEGYGSYYLYPDNPITRAEAVTLLDKILKFRDADNVFFIDVGKNHWAYGAIARAAEAGVVSGYPDMTFGPDRYVTRMEMAAMLANAIGLEGMSGMDYPFKDMPPGYWGTPIIRRLKANGLIDGYEDGTFRPEATATRAEFMHLVVEMLDL